jgi:small subunit ribosomal protein S12
MPQKKGICTKLVIRTPKKPNSALRKLAKLKLSNKKQYMLIFLEKDIIYKNIQQFLIRGGRVKDLPGVKYHLIRGKLRFLD